MKQKFQLSPKQKTTLKKAPQYLAALLIMGIVGTQINQNKEIDALKTQHAPDLELAEEVQETLSEQSVMESPEIVESQEAENIEADATEVEEVVATQTLAKPAKQTKTVVASPKSVAKTSSAVAYSSMNMQVKGYSGKLSWASSFQRNIKSFAIERSIDDEQYTEIGRIDGEGKGEFTQENLYEFEDTGLMYVQMPSVQYRIKQIGINGDKDYSDVIEYDLGLPEGLYASVEIMDKKQVLIHYAATSAGPMEYKILNTFGEPVSQGKLQGEYEPQSMLLEAGQWKKGAYYLQLESAKHSFMESFTIE